jgi:succinate-semialdehyde dehydrogenase/glutarate-semialdehyde dehydrogenase
VGLGVDRRVRVRLRETPVVRYADSMQDIEHRAYVGGEWIATESRFDVTDPASGERLATVSDADAALARQAVDAAHDALASWRSTTAHARASILRRIRALHAEREDELATLLTREQGKPLAEARAEIRYAGSFYEWFAEEGLRAYGETIPSPFPGHRVMTFRQPVGVGAAITPWNFPSAMIARKLAPALAAGCTFVLKPSELTPLSALAIARLCEVAGVPKGVVNVVPTSDAARVGEVLTGDGRVRALSFTGSTAVGKKLYAACASTVKKLALELGGNAPFLVFDDADLDAAVDGLMVAKLRNGGQTCVAANRILVQRAVHDAFCEKLASKLARVKVGPGLEEGVTLGPMIDARAIAKIEAHVEDARDRGAKVVLGGKSLGGSFYAPTLITGVTPQMQMASTETFGPVAGILAFDTEAEGIALANDTPSGLAAYFYARDVGRVFRVAEALEVGMVGVGTGTISTPVAPFGGVKESGLGREGSKHGLEEWTELKYVCVGLESPR